jgi:hypothetical protein
MTKKELFKALTPEQRDFVEFLIDTAYCKGLSEGRIEEHVRNEYGR